MAPHWPFEFHLTPRMNPLAVFLRGKAREACQRDGCGLVPQNILQAAVLVLTNAVANTCAASALMMLVWGIWFLMPFQLYPAMGIPFLIIGAGRLIAVHRPNNRARRVLSFLSVCLWLWVLSSLLLAGVRSAIVPTVVFFALGDACRFWTLPRA